MTMGPNDMYLSDGTKMSMLSVEELKAREEQAAYKKELLSSTLLQRERDLNTNHMFLRIIQSPNLIRILANLMHTNGK
jgi:hypothetical protein